jgi:hypothetical protein
MTIGADLGGVQRVFLCRKTVSNSRLPSWLRASSLHYSVGSVVCGATRALRVSIAVAVILLWLAST